MSSLWIAVCVPPTTALRHIAVMEAEGLIKRTPDPQDRRRVFIDLNDEIAQVLMDLLGP